MGINLGIECCCCQKDNPVNMQSESKIDSDFNENVLAMKKESSTKESMTKSSEGSTIVIQSFYRRYDYKKKFWQSLHKRSQLFNQSIIQFGRFITEEELNQRLMSSNKIEREKKLEPFKLTERERKKFFLVFVKGAFRFNDNTIYKGSWNYIGKKHGYGIFIQDTGSKYEGLWENDAMSGRGRYIDAKGNYYEGQWNKGNAEGKGLLVLADGCTYEGEWKNDMQNGFGREVFSDGSHYEGSYFNGQKEGEGKFTWSDGSFYEGTFANSTINGKGMFKWKDGRRYTGQWENNKMNGTGVFEWPNNNKYEGEYKLNRKEGKGIYYWNGTTFYKGNWLNNTQHGEGEFHHNGTITKGIFRFGRLAKSNEGNKNQKKKVSFSQEEMMNESNHEHGDNNNLIPSVRDSFRLSN